MNTKHNTASGINQKGAAILVITILLLLIGTIGTLMIGRIGLQEQKVVGIDVRSKEVYSAAVGGLEYSVDWVQDVINLESLTWTDVNGDGQTCDGDTASPTAMANTTLNADVYAHNLIYTLNNCINERPLFITAISQAVAQGDSHVVKAVSVDVMLGEESIFADTVTGGTPGTFSGPPIMVEGCMDNITGNPDVYANNGIAIGTTMGTNDNTCLDEGHLGLNNITGTGKAALNPTMPLSEAIFGIPDVNHEDLDPSDPGYQDALNDGETQVEAMLMNLQMQDPAHVFVVNASYPYNSSVQPAPSGAGFQNEFFGEVGDDGQAGTDDDVPVILYVASKSLCVARQVYEPSLNCDFDPCPKLNGGTTVIGLVYYADDSCTSQGFGGGTIYGTLAKKGDLEKLNSNAEIYGRDIPFSGGSGPGDDQIDISITSTALFSEIPGTWRDY
ncbi:MAG: hypothetical protein M0Q95_00525 [Porticoccaceae bacterium]|nr:hypothetical protein [Porticoccaceae bacterium]